MRFILTLSLALFVSACSGFILNRDTDTKVDGGWGYYNEFTIYSTKHDVFAIINPHALDADIKTLRRPGGKTAGAMPRSVDEYFSNIDAAKRHAVTYGINIIGVLEKDTKFKVVKLVKYSNWSLWFALEMIILFTLK